MIFYCAVDWFVFILILFWSLECMLYPVLILAYEMVFIKPFAFLHNLETEIKVFEE